MNSKAKWQYQSYKVYLQKPYLSQAIALVRHVLRWIKGYTLKNKNPNKKGCCHLKKTSMHLGTKNMASCPKGERKRRDCNGSCNLRGCMGELILYPVLSGLRNWNCAMFHFAVLLTVTKPWISVDQVHSYPSSNNT